MLKGWIDLEKKKKTEVTKIARERERKRLKTLQKEGRVTPF